jgi:hypothetical protein
MTLYNDVLNELQYYMLDENNIRKSIEMKFKYIPNNNKPNKKHNNINHTSVSKPKNNIFIPREKDTLFWCFYILKNGEVKYETTNNKNDVIATRLKIEYVEKIRNEKQTIKTYKFDTINNIESNLSNDKILNVKTFLSLCAIENINVLIVNNKTYYKLLMNDSDEIFIIYCLYSGNKSYERRYGFEIGTPHTINNIETTLYRVENIDKPIKPITAYKVEDLMVISNKLAIETSNAQTGKGKSKKDLYQDIVQYF